MGWDFLKLILIHDFGQRDMISHFYQQKSRKCCSITKFLAIPISQNTNLESFAPISQTISEKLFSAFRKAEAPIDLEHRAIIIIAQSELNREMKEAREKNGRAPKKVSTKKRENWKLKQSRHAPSMICLFASIWYASSCAVFCSSLLFGQSSSLRLKFGLGSNSDSNNCDLSKAIEAALTKTMRFPKKKSSESCLFAFRLARFSFLFCRCGFAMDFKAKIMQRIMTKQNEKH